MSDDNFADWCEHNKEVLLEEYTQQLDEFPASVYEGYLDDQHELAEEHYINNFTLEQIDNNWLSIKYDEMEGRNF